MAKIDKRGRMIAIADYLFANPNKERADVLSKFGKAWQMSVRTVDRIIREAKEYNSERISEQEKIKNEVMSEQTRTFTKDAVMSRQEYEEFLTKTARGVARKIGDDIMMPSFGESLKAGENLAKLKGWEPAQKIESNEKITIKYKGIGD